MKLKRGSFRIPLPPIGEFIGARWETADRMTYAVCRVDIASMLKMREQSPDVVGRPIYICLIDDHEAVIFPATDDEGHLRIRYFPLAMEI